MASKVKIFCLMVPPSVTYDRAQRQLQGSARPALHSRQHAQAWGTLGDAEARTPSTLVPWERPLGDMSPPSLEPFQVLPTLLMRKLRLWSGGTS